MWHLSVVAVGVANRPAADFMAVVRKEGPHCQTDRSVVRVSLVKVADQRLEERRVTGKFFGWTSFWFDSIIVSFCCFEKLTHWIHFAHLIAEGFSRARNTVFNKSAGASQQLEQFARSGRETSVVLLRPCSQFKCIRGATSWPVLYIYVTYQTAFQKGPKRPAHRPGSQCKCKCWEYQIKLVSYLNKLTILSIRMKRRMVCSIGTETKTYLNFDNFWQIDEFWRRGGWCPQLALKRKLI